MYGEYCQNFQHVIINHKIETPGVIFFLIFCVNIQKHIGYILVVKGDRDLLRLVFVHN